MASTPDCGPKAPDKRGSGRRPLQRALTPEEFAFETRLVILNALSMVPSAGQPSSSFGSSSAGEQAHQKVTPTASTGSSSEGHSLGSSRDSTSLHHVLPTLPEASLAEKLHDFHPEPWKKGVLPVPLHASSSSKLEPSADAPLSLSGAAMLEADGDDQPDGVDELDGFYCPQRPTFIPLKRSPMVKSEAFQGDSSQVDGQMPSPLAGPENPSALARSVSQLERQASNLSDSSVGESDGSSLIHSKISSVSRGSAVSNRVDIQRVDVQAMVKSHVLPQVAVPLKEEINQEMSLLGKDFEEARRCGRVRSEQVSALATPGGGLTTPESEVARWLAMIGDQVEEEHGAKLERAASKVLSRRREEVTYDVLRGLAGELLNQSSGWTRVALVLMFTQKVSFGLLARGERGLHELVEYSSKMLMDYAADFIISRGGWGAVWDAESPSSGVPSPFLAFESRQDLARTSAETVLPEDSITDSAVSSGLTTTLDTAICPIARDDTMQSIASLAHSELATPAESNQDFPDASKPIDIPTVVEEPSDASGKSTPEDSGLGTASKSSPCSESGNCVAGAEDAVERLQPEITLLRQASLEMSNKAEAKTEQHSQTVLLLTVTGCVLLAISGAFLYKKMKS